jgi:superfamily II DNA or RNA helicase
VAAAFRAEGVTAETVTGEMPGRARADLIARFDRGEVQVLTNCMVLTEGFDSQPIGCIVILRPMRHKGTFIQAVGRGLRKVEWVVLLVGVVLLVLGGAILAVYHRVTGLA